MTTAPWVQMYGIWSEEGGWWFTELTVFHTEHYSVALAQRNMLQRYFDTYYSGEKHHWEVREMPDEEVQE